MNLKSKYCIGGNCKWNHYGAISTFITILSSQKRLKAGLLSLALMKGALVTDGWSLCLKNEGYFGEMTRDSGMV